MSDNNNKNEWQERELGGLWLKEGKSGPFLSGQINGQEVVVYKNKDYEDGGNRPYYRVYKSKPLEGQKPEPAKKEDGIPF